MRIQSCPQAWLATAVCMMAGLPFAAADDAPGVFRMTDFPSTQIQQTGFFRATLGPQNDGCGSLACGEVACCPTENCCPAPAECCPVPGNICCETACGAGCSSSSNGCGCGCPGNENTSIFGRIFGGSKSRCSCDSCDYCGKGTSGSRSDKSRTLYNSTNKTVPFCGKYQITYANQPSYADARDGMAWAAQGYGMPVTVPTAPVVRYSYNYSHGTPASRLTPLSTYNASTSLQPLFLQSW
jgi:hypothetical protein